MFEILRAIIIVITLIDMALFPNEWKLVVNLGVSCLLLTYTAEDLENIINRKNRKK